MQSIIGSVNQLAAWIPHLKLKIPIMRKMTGSTTLFKDSKELREEFNSLKKDLRSHIKIAPFDTKLGLHIHTDASSEGLGFVMSQPL